jgi:hypothetical protein
MPKVSSIYHDPLEHKVYDLSNTIIVLIFGELTSFVRKILQREENKGAELTVYRGNGCGRVRVRGRERNAERNRMQNPKGCLTRREGDELQKAK